MIFLSPETNEPTAESSGCSSTNTFLFISTRSQSLFLSRNLCVYDVYFSYRPVTIETCIACLLDDDSTNDHHLSDDDEETSIDPSHVMDEGTTDRWIKHQMKCTKT
jgi:hypothetical protein